ncbi:MULTISPECIES: RagB/SusD family nutrient uptake outer membrane protein [Butyricimonas]|uniref:RagB/SusD family nutrient uptake outer membrane protein n=1 Tax=Butyricimonas TaxID=574697 RepID=UPI0007FB23B0|nr:MULTISPECIES: RagB/SusD family nutrient uptake outer membrane protein [Butyricimonas]
MKKIYLIGILSFFLGACNDFLEEKSQDEVRPSSVSDMEKILEGNAYFEKEDGVLFNTITDYFTDNIKVLRVVAAKEEMKKRYAPRYRWEVDMFDESSGVEDLTLWTRPYELIKGCNLVLEYAPQMDGDAKKREHLMGEALVLRGFYYMFLVNCFGLPYNEGDPNTNPGVPLKLISGVNDDYFKRNTVAEVYAQIEKDLLAGVEILEENELELYDDRLNAIAAYALLSRMYMYMEDWDNALKYADMVLDRKSKLLNLGEQPKNSWSSYSVYSDKNLVEALWIMPWSPSYSEYDYAAVDPYVVSNDLCQLYDQDVDGGIGDARCEWDDYNDQDLNGFIRGAYMQDGTGSYAYHPVGLDKGNPSTPYNGGVRVAEMYLNRAEVYCRRYVESGASADAEKALADLNELRRNRFYAGYADKTLEAFGTPQELLDFCLRERRRELCGEANHRWFDLRRLGMPKIDHVFVDNATGNETTYTLMQGDKRYALPIPRKVMEKNPLLEQNQY